MPVSDRIWNAIMKGEEDAIMLDLTDGNVDLFMDKKNNMKPLKRITLTNKGRIASYELTEETNIEAYLDENGEVWTFQSLDGRDGYQWLYVQFVLGKRDK